MRYFVTLIGKDKYAFNGNKFTKDVRIEVTKGVYEAVLNSPLFSTELYEGFSDIDTSIEHDVSYEPMNIALAYSPNWSLYVRVQIYNIFKYNPPPINIYLLSDEHGGIDASDICEYFGAGYTVKNICVEELYRGLLHSNKNVSSRFTKYTLYRLLIPYLIDVDRLLYLDSDSLVCGDITNMYNMKLDGALLAGVMDIGSAVGAVKKAINFEPDEVYINAGVTLMNLAGASELAPKWIEMCNSKFYNCHDQDILNITCKGKIKLISNIYNASLSTGFPVDNIKIAHYAGPKPWDNIARVHNKIANQWTLAIKEFTDKGFRRIPKTIFYCWFGGAEKPDTIKKCISSWKCLMLDYKIVEINETNFDYTKHGEYVKQAYEAKKWAFVTDYCRLYFLYHFGGIYMDADVMAVRPLDKFLNERAFTGHETKDLIITATMGAEPMHPWINYLLSFYAKAKFDNTPNTKTVSAMSNKLITHKEDNYKELDNGVKIFPVEYFCSYDHKNLQIIPTNSAYTYHLFAGTWVGRTVVCSKQ